MEGMKIKEQKKVEQNGVLENGEFDNTRMTTALQIVVGCGEADTLRENKRGVISDIVQCSSPPTVCGACALALIETCGSSSSIFPTPLEGTPDRF